LLRGGSGKRGPRGEQIGLLDDPAEPAERVSLFETLSSGKKRGSYRDVFIAFSKRLTLSVGGP
jgi:hypothetical protein